MNEENSIKFSAKWIIWLGVFFSLLSIFLASDAWWQLGQARLHEAKAHPTEQHEPAITRSDAVYRGLKSFEMGEVYDHVGHEFRGAHPSVQREMEVARWIGAIVKLAAIGLIIYGLFNKSILQMQARRKASHLVIIGASDFAERLARTVHDTPIHLRKDDEIVQCDHVIRLPMGDHLPNALAGASAHNAAQIVIAIDRDDRALDLAMRIRQHCRESSEKRQANLKKYSPFRRALTLFFSQPARLGYPVPEVSVRMNDPMLGRRAHQLNGNERLHALSHPDLSAHFVTRRHPPFLLARDQSQKQIHSLLIGDHDWIEAVFLELVLNSCTFTYGKPIVSFVCHEPRAFEDRLRHRYPEVNDVASLHFSQAGQLTHTETFNLQLEATTLIAPVTAVYITFADCQAGLAIALTWREHALRKPSHTAPIFFLSDVSLERPAPGSHLDRCTLVPFGAMEDLINASGFLSQEAAQAERDYHEAYRKIPKAKKGPADEPWENLEEEYRISNRRAVAHICAKLFEMGFDLRPWMATHDIWATLPTLAVGQNLYNSPADRELLARLEHERWMADRRLNGWIYGQDKDRELKIHDDLQDFDKLSDKVKSYDVSSIEALNSTILKRTSDGVSRP